MPGGAPVGKHGQPCTGAAEEPEGTSRLLPADGQAVSADQGVSASASTLSTRSTSGSSGAEAARRAVGFLVLDPMHRDGRVVGYNRNLLRTGLAAHSGTPALLTKVRVASTWMAVTRLGGWASAC